jgi:ELWxxDGT repeat protein
MTARTPTIFGSWTERLPELRSFPRREPTRPTASFPDPSPLFGSEVLFSGLDTAQRAGLWVTNGTSAGTSELSVAHSQLFSQGLDSLTVLGNSNKVLFVATDGSDNTTLWVTDGTGAGTSELAVPNSEAFSQGIGGLTTLGSEVLFAGTDQDFKANLWVTNGTAAGTSELSVPVAGPNPDLEPDNFLVFGSGSEVLFTGDDANGLNNLWVTKGTGPGTSELSVAGAGPFGLSGYAFATFGSKVLFNGEDAKHHRELWITNGTAAGTSELSVAGAFSEGLNPGSFVVFGSEVLFQVHGADGAANLWVTNGTVAGTSQVFPHTCPV